MCLQVNRYPFRECNCAIFMSAYLLNLGQLFTESVCSLGSKFVPVRVDPTFEGLVAEGSKQEIVIADRGRCFPSLRWRNHIEVYQLTLKHLPPVGANVFPLTHCLLVDLFHCYMLDKPICRFRVVESFFVAFILVFDGISC